MKRTRMQVGLISIKLVALLPIIIFCTLRAQSQSVSVFAYSPSQYQAITPATAPSLEIVAQIPVRGSDSGLAWSPDSRMLALPDWTLGLISLYDARDFSGAPRQLLMFQDGSGFEFTPEGRVGIFFALDGEALIVDGMAYRVLDRENAVLWFPLGVYNVSTGDYVATIDVEGETATVDRSDLQPSSSFGASLQSFGLSPDLRYAVTGYGRSPDNLRIIDLSTGEIVTRITHGQGAVLTVNYSPDGQLLASGGGDQTTRLWDVATQQEVANLEHPTPVQAVVFSPDSQLVATGASQDYASTSLAVIQLWDRQGRPLRALESRLGVVSDLAFSPDGLLLAAAGCMVSGGDCKQGGVELFDVTSGQHLTLLELPADSDAQVNRTRIAFSPNGYMLAARDDGGTTIWIAQ